MSEKIYAVDEDFPVQFAWQLPDKDYLRAIFRAKVLFIDNETDKYTVRLEELLAGRQEDPQGNPRDSADLSREYWTLVGELIGRRIAVAFEAGDGQALHMRFATLTGEHTFFSRYDKAEKWLNEQDQGE